MNRIEDHGDVILTEDGSLLIVYRSHPLLSRTGRTVTDGDLACEAFVDFCVDGSFLLSFDAPDRERLTRILKAEQEGLSVCYADSKVRNDIPMMEAYRHDIDSLDDAARIIIGQFPTD